MIKKEKIQVIPSAKKRDLACYTAIKERAKIFIQQNGHFKKYSLEDILMTEKWSHFQNT